MIERLQRALEHIEELSPEAQADLAQQIEDFTEPLDDIPDTSEPVTDAAMPRTVRAALALAGAWRDLQGDDEFEALHRVRHERQPTPPADEQLAWLDDIQQ
jgi:hypothetical protein